MKKERVIATGRGFDNICIREVGEEFDMPVGMPSSWWRPVSELSPAELENLRGKKEKVDAARSSGRALPTDDNGDPIV